METIWIMGAGRFGLRAASVLTTRQNNFRIILVDQDQKKLDLGSGAIIPKPFLTCWKK